MQQFFEYFFSPFQANEITMYYCCKEILFNYRFALNYLFFALQFEFCGKLTFGLWFCNTCEYRKIEIILCLPVWPFLDTNSHETVWNTKAIMQMRKYILNPQIAFKNPNARTFKVPLPAYKTKSFMDRCPATYCLSAQFA